MAVEGRSRISVVRGLLGQAEGAAAADLPQVVKDGFGAFCDVETAARDDSELADGQHIVLPLDRAGQLQAHGLHSTDTFHQRIEPCPRLARESAKQRPCLVEVPQGLAGYGGGWSRLAADTR